MRQKRFSSTAFIGLVIFGYLSGHAESNPQARAASTLFKQYETVVYARTEFLSNLPAPSSPDIFKLDAYKRDMRFPFLELLGGLGVLSPDLAGVLEKSYRVFLVGAKDFTEPEGLGMVSSTKCYIGVLENGAQPNIEVDFRSASYVSIAGKRIWTWSVPPYEGHPRPTSFYAAQVAGPYFVMTNDLTAFQEAANALVSTESVSAPSDVFGWDTFSPYKYWAYRHFGRSGTVTGTKFQPTEEEGSLRDVVAMAFFADLDKGQGFLQVFSSDKSMKAVPKALLPDVDQNWLQPQKPGVWYARFPLSGSTQDDNPLFTVIGFLGFALYL